MSDGENLKIVAAPSMGGESCSFNLEPPPYKDVYATFDDSSEAKGSPLAEKLFELESVRRVGIAPGAVTVTAEGYPDWRVLGKQVGSAIREHHAAGEAAVSQTIVDKLSAAAPVRQKLQELIEHELSPALAGHGGFVRLLAVDVPRAYVELGGGCQGCGMAATTVKQGIEVRIMEAVPEITEVIDQTDHASGSNPYFQGGK